MGLKKKPVLLAAADAAARKKNEEGKWGVKVREVKDILDDTMSVVSNTVEDTITTLLDDDLEEEDFYSDDESMISREDDESMISRHSTASRNSLNKSARDRIAQARPVPVEKKEDKKQQQQQQKQRKNKNNNGRFKRMKKGRRIRFWFFGQRSKKNRSKKTPRALETTTDETFEDDTMWIDRIADKFGCLCGNFDDAYSYDDDTVSFDSYSYGSSENGNFIP